MMVGCAAGHSGDRGLERGEREVQPDGPGARQKEEFRPQRLPVHPAAQLRWTGPGLGVSRWGSTQHNSWSK